MARLYRAYAAAREASKAGAAAGTDRDRAEPIPGESPIDRIRTIMHEARNHFSELEDAAETFAAELALAGNGLYFALCEHLRARQCIRVRVLPVEVMTDRLRWYDHHRRQLMISEVVEPPGRTFQAAYHFAVCVQGCVRFLDGSPFRKASKTESLAQTVYHIPADLRVKKAIMNQSTSFGARGLIVACFTDCDPVWTKQGRGASG